MVRAGVSVWSWRSLKDRMGTVRSGWPVITYRRFSPRGIIMRALPGALFLKRLSQQVGRSVVAAMFKKLRVSWAVIASRTLPIASSRASWVRAWALRKSPWPAPRRRWPWDARRNFGSNTPQAR
jgi:hypothetical protein